MSSYQILAIKDLQMSYYSLILHTYLIRPEITRVENNIFLNLSDWKKTWHVLHLTD